MCMRVRIGKVNGGKGDQVYGLIASNTGSVKPNTCFGCELSSYDTMFIEEAFDSY